jgi:hypothetical protein
MPAQGTRERLVGARRTGQIALESNPISHLSVSRSQHLGRQNPLSRGRGRIQAGILALLRRGGFWSAAEFAQALLKSQSAAALSSVRRALRDLEREGAILSAPATGTTLLWQLAEVERRRQQREQRRARKQEREDAKLRALLDQVRPSPNPARLKLAKTLGLLGSNQDGEILSAARAAERQRKELGLSWAALLGLRE